MIKLRKVALDILYTLKAAGADEAECTIISNSTDETNSLGKNIYLIREFDSTDAEFRIVKNGRSAQMSINQFDKESINNAVKCCIDMVNSDNSSMDCSLGYIGEMQPDRLLNMKRDSSKLYMRFEEFMRTLKNDYPSISSDAIAWYRDSKTLYINTLGQELCSHNQSCGLDWQGGASDGVTTTDFCFFGVECTDLSTPFIEQGMVREKLRTVQNMFNPQKIRGDKFVGTIILNPEALSEYAYQIISRINTMKNDDGLPIPTCSPNVSLYKANSDIPYASNMAANNSPSAEVQYIIKNGAIIPDPLNNLSAEEKTTYYIQKEKKYKNLENSVVGMESGDSSYKELISNVKRGLLIGHINGTMPSKDGDFSGVAKNSFYIEDGEIKFPVIETMVSGNVFEMFNHVEGISKETIYNYGTLFPWMAVSGISIK